MIDNDKNPQSGSPAKNEMTENRLTPPATKKPFVEPQISQPIDVLEATTFFQAVDSGASN